MQENEYRSGNICSGRGSETRMNKAFNITADCKPGLHYMVDLHSRLEQIRGYVDRGEYLSINRARQYGKTTTLFERYLPGIGQASGSYY